MSFSHLFYDIMHYKTPSPKDFFVYKNREQQDLYTKTQKAGRDKLQESVSKNVEKIKKRQRMRKYMPFVEYVFLAGDITFNSKNISTIDLVVICSPQRMWIVRLYTIITLYIQYIIQKITKSHQKKLRVVLYGEHGYTDLYALKANNDPYFLYWFIHFVTLYERNKDMSHTIYHDNKRIQPYFPNFPMHTVINIGIEAYFGESGRKKQREKILSGFIGDIINSALKYFSLLFLLYKKQAQQKYDIFLSNSVISTFPTHERTLCSIKRNVLAKKHYTRV